MPAWSRRCSRAAADACARAACSTACSPAGPVGAIAGRTLRYFRRDPRQVVNIVMLLLLPAIFLGLALMNGLQQDSAGFAPAITLIPAINALLAGSIVQMAIAYDNDAVALHILTGVSGTADRAGRLLGFALIAVPITVLLCVASCLLAGRADLLPGSLGAALGLMAVSAGAGSWVGRSCQDVLRHPRPTRSDAGPPAARSPSSRCSSCPRSRCCSAAPPSASRSRRSGSRPGLGEPRGRRRPRGAALWGGTVLGGRVLQRRWPEVLTEVASDA